MSKQRRWQEPSTVVARIEYRELRKELRRAGSKKRRDELIAKLDALYVRGVGSSAPTKEPSRKKNGSPLAASPSGESASQFETPVSSISKPPAAEEKGLDYWTGVMDKIEDEKVAFRRRYEASSPAERTRLFAERYPQTPPAEFPELAKCFRLPECDVKPHSPDSELRRLGRKFGLRDCDEPGPVLSEPDVPAPALQPAGESSVNLDAQVDLILLIDPPLTRLAAHSPALDSQIRGAITLQVQEHGHCDGVWLANLYNAMRPKGFGAFPPRSF